MWLCTLHLLLLTLLVPAASPFLFANRFPPLKQTNQPSESREVAVTKRIPKYMVQLYQTLTTSDGLLKGGMPYDVNAIRGIYSKRLTKPSPAIMEMYYDIAYLKGHFTARRDEIHLFMKRLNVNDRNIFRPYVLTLHDIHTGQLIRKFKVPAFNHGWQVLSLRGWSNRWAQTPIANKGLRLTVYRGRRKKLADVNPFIQFPHDKDPYMILFGDDNENELLGWRFLSSYPMNSVADFDTTYSERRRRRATSRRTQAPQCVATKTSVKLKGRKINNEHIIIEPESLRITQCTNTCIPFPQRGDHPLTKKLLAQKLLRICCVPQHFQALAFLITEPSRHTITFATIPNVAPTHCTWSAR